MGEAEGVTPRRLASQHEFNRAVAVALCLIEAALVHLDPTTPELIQLHLSTAQLVEFVTRGGGDRDG
jgi:hypothetical protein